MSRKFSDFLRELEDETRREGPKAIAEYEAFGAHYRLAAELLTLRRKRGLTQRQLARKTRIPQSEISRIEGGNANPTLSTIAVLASALGTEVRLVASRRTARIWSARNATAAQTARRRAHRATRRTSRRVR